MRKTQMSAARRIAVLWAPLWSFAAAVGFAPGCGTVDDATPTITLGARPYDGSTGLPVLDVTFGASRGNRGLSAAERDSFAQGLSIATWPALAPIQAVLTVTAAAGSGEGANGNPTSESDTFELSPNQDVADGWYIALASTHLDHATWQEPFDLYTGPDGVVGVRVHVGSAPRLWGIQSCPKGAASDVTVTFSEPVVPASDAASLPIIVDVSGASCTLVNTLTPGATAESFVFACAGTDPTGAVDVTLLDGLTSSSGIGVSPISRSVSADSTVDSGGGCRTYRDPISI